MGCLPLAGAGNQPAAAGAGNQETVAAAGIPARLWPRLSPDDPPPGLLDALRAALVLLADHELAASTLAARVAASVRADPYAVVATGLGAVGGALHGGASLGAETMLAAAQDAAGAPRVVGELLRRGERVPGFGHFVYRGGDPRAGLLLAMVATGGPGLTTAGRGGRGAGRDAPAVPAGAEYRLRAGRAGQLRGDDPGRG